MEILYDLHAHTHLSVCGDDSATIENYVASAKKHGLKLIGIADHMWDKEIAFTDSMRRSRASGGGDAVVNWYKAQSIEHCREVLKEIEAADTENTKFIFGGEVDYCPGVGAAITAKHAEELDFMIVPNSHTHHIMDAACYEPYEKHADFMLKATMEICTAETAKYVTSLAHPFDAVCCPYSVDFIIDEISDAQLGEVFSAAAENGIAAEINGASFANIGDIKNSGLFRVLAAAKTAGCRFTFGSDSHSDGQQDAISLCSTVADLLGLTENDMLFYDKLLNSRR